MSKNLKYNDENTDYDSLTVSYDGLVLSISDVKTNPKKDYKLYIDTTHKIRNNFNNQIDESKNI